ncbi:hypothetical protein OUZ56_005997 [Daphnia magna]|uniref:Uncharacterized protein n=1 Tax=Daphnia magna TaxID=35525 RepID=A0ABQ9YVR1_9CRUS|nr:hypothetical protein OUZ56_005997 [Daphnia magna]
MSTQILKPSCDFLVTTVGYNRGVRPSTGSVHEGKPNPVDETDLDLVPSVKAGMPRITGTAIRDIRRHSRRLPIDKSISLLSINTRNRDSGQLLATIVPEIFLCNEKTQSDDFQTVGKSQQRQNSNPFFNTSFSLTSYFFIFARNEKFDIVAPMYFVA